MKSVQELEELRKRAQDMVRLREGGDKTRVIVGMGTCGIAAGAREALTAIMDELAKRNIQDVLVTQTGCVGLCEREPLVTIEKPGKPKVTYGKVTPERARQILVSHVINDQIVGEWVVSAGSARA